MIRRRDKLPGGKGDRTRVADVDPRELKRGCKVEREHTSSPKLACEIALDHLTEDPRYYTKLAKIHLDGPRRRSPIRLRKLYPDETANRRNKPRLDQPIYKWVCDDANVQAAEFAHKKYPHLFSVLHRSPKKDGAGQWQVSTFDQDGAVGDRRYPDCTRALNEDVPFYAYRLRKVVSTDGLVALTGARQRRRRR